MTSRRLGRRVKSQGPPPFSLHRRTALAYVVHHGKLVKVDLRRERVIAKYGEGSPAELATAWRASVEGLPVPPPPLSDAAISRDSIYDMGK